MNGYLRQIVLFFFLLLFNVCHFNGFFFFFLIKTQSVKNKNNFFLDFVTGYVSSRNTSVDAAVSLLEASGDLACTSGRVGTSVSCSVLVTVIELSLASVVDTTR